MLSTFTNQIKNNLPAFGNFSSVPAGMIDNAYLEERHNLLGHAWQFIKIRAMYSLLFTPAATIDLVTSAMIASRFAVGTFFTTDATQDNRLAGLKKYASLFSKNLIALCATPIGIMNPKLVETTFINHKPMKGVLAGGSYHHAPNAKYVYPKTEAELIKIVKDAHQYKKKIIPMGAGLSQGKQFLPVDANGTEEVVIDLREFNSISINTEEKVATVGAGVRWADLQLRANHEKLALKTMQASNVFSVGGSIGTNIHGWDHKAGFLSNTIRELTIITPEGKKKVLTPDDPQFHLITSGFGLFGIVISAKIELTKNKLLKEKSIKIPLKDYVNYFYNNVQKNKDIKMHFCRLPLDGKHLMEYGIAVDYVNEDKQEAIVTPNLNKEGIHGTRFERVVANMARHFPWVRKKYWQREETRLLANDSAALSRNEIMQPSINAMFTGSKSEAEWLQEYFLPGENLEAFVKGLRRIIKEHKVPLLNASIRFVKQDKESLLCPAYGGDRFAVVICFTQSLHPERIIDAQKWLREAQALTVKLNGSYYLPYQHVSNPEDFQKAYPRAQEVNALKQTYDPKGVLASGFYQKYLTPNQNQKNYFKLIMQNPALKKEFTGFLENVLQRVDTDKIYDLLTDILKYKDTHAEIYEELCQRLPQIMPTTVGSFKRILNSLTDICHDLGEQAKLLLPKDLKTINGLIEIGYPGRFIKGFKQAYQVKGPIVAAYEQPSITDYVEAGFPRPYEKFVPLDYSEPSLKDLRDDSADVITCYVGLHHFPKDKLDAFLADIRRVLRDGGHFLLVDHDVSDEKAMIMAHGAHMFFNAVNGVSLESELNETRNFRPISEWRVILAKHDLSVSVPSFDVPMIREGDPSRNRMVSFVKKAPENILQMNKTQNAAHDNDDTYVTKPAVVWQKQPQSAPVTATSCGLFNKQEGIVKKSEMEQEKIYSMEL